MSFRSAFRISLFVWSVAPLACAVATGEPEVDPEDGGSGSGMGGSLLVAGNGGTSPVTMTTAGKATNMGGNITAFGGTTSTGGGKAGSTSTGGKTNTAGEGGATTSAGKGGSSSAGSSSAGSSSAGTSAAAGSGSGGTGSATCGALRTWMPATSMMISADEVIQWMGKRYKATQAIDWTNAECKPDAPVTWCATWFTVDGDC